MSIFFSTPKQRHQEAARITRETTLKVTNGPRERKEGVDKGGGEALTDEPLNNINRMAASIWGEEQKQTKSEMKE